MDLSIKKPYVKFKSCDDKEFKVDLETAKVLKTIWTMLETLGTEDLEDEVIPLPNIQADVFEKVIEWAHYHKDDLDFPVSEKVYPRKMNNLCPWDSQYLEAMDYDTLVLVMHAANYLDVKGLLYMTCGKIATNIKGKTMAQIRGPFFMF